MNPFAKFGLPLDTRQPLTKEQIVAIWQYCDTPSKRNNWTTGPYPFARAIEAAHGIKEQEPTPLPVHQPLTDDAALRVVMQAQDATRGQFMCGTTNWAIHIVRAVEAAHGIAKAEGGTP